MAELRGLLEEAAGPEPLPLSAAMLRSQADLRRRQHRHRRLAAGLAAAALAVLAVVVPRMTARPADPADGHRTTRVEVGPLPPGRYLGRVAGTPLTFTIPSGEPWTASRVTAEDLLLTEPDVTFGVEVTRVTSLYAFDSNGVTMRRTQPVPADLVQWLQTRRGVNIVGPVVPTRLAGRPARLLEIVVNEDYRPGPDLPEGALQSCGNPEHCFALGTTSQDPLVLYTNSFLLLVITDGPAEPRLIATASIPITELRDYRQARATALGVLASFSTSP